MVGALALPRQCASASTERLPKPSRVLVAVRVLAVPLMASAPPHRQLSPT
jgi:hypothetical protein